MITQDFYKLINFVANKFIFVFSSLRAKLWRIIGAEIGAGSQILGGTVMLSASNIRIGSQTTINTNCRLDGHGGLSIGDNVMIGANCQIISATHNIDRFDIPMKFQGIKKAFVTVGDDVWIGASVIILPGVTVGRGSVIGAGSIVTKNIPEFAICAGNPAKLIRFRK